MAQWLFIIGILVFSAILSGRLLHKYGVPTLLIFLLLGVVMGKGGFLGLEFSGEAVTTDICSAALVFILFYGGFSMRWDSAKPVSVKATLMSTSGVIATTVIVGLFVSLASNLELTDSLLLGAVVSCTDTALIFSVFKTRRLNLKNGLASLIGMESALSAGVASIIALTILGITEGHTSAPLDITAFVFKQFFFAVLMGGLMAFVAVMILKRNRLDFAGLYPILVISFVLVTYSSTEALEGSAYLSVFILGIAMGNARFAHRQSLIRVFEGIAWLAQCLLFLILGLLVQPSQLAGYALPAAACIFALLFVARPAVTAMTLTPLKVSGKEQIFIAFSGMRGAASITIATTALAHGLPFAEALFGVVFLLCLFSVAVQGVLIKTLAGKLKLTDKNTPAPDTFND